MSGISSGVGLISGIDTASLIESLMALQAKPQKLLKTRVTEVQSQQTAIADLSARLLGLLNTVKKWKDTDSFQAFGTTSSDDNVLTATASQDALPGTVDLIVKSLVSNHQLVSSGFADANTTPVGAGRLTVEMGKGKLDPATALGDLNGGQGVRRGSIEIVDGAGRSAVIDLSAAVDTDDVLAAINTDTRIRVTARVSGGHLVLEDRSGGAGTLTVSEVSGGATAADLGIKGTATDGTLTGRDVYYLADGTLLSRLNDGNGVRHNAQGEDLRITTSDGSSFTVSLVGILTDSTRLETLNSGKGVRLGQVRVTNRAGVSGVVDLSGARTIGDVKQALANATDTSGQSLQIDVNYVAVGGVGSLVITDKSAPVKDGTSKLIVEDVSGFAARDLGIAQSTIKGSYQGNGIGRVSTIGDVVRAINYASGNDGFVTAAMSAAGLTIQDNTLGAGAMTIEELTSGTGTSHAAADLGIVGTFESGTATSRSLLAGLNTVLLASLNGGSGVELGRVSFVARNGTTTELDFSGAQTVQDVLEIINASTATSGVTASLNAAGNGIAVTDVSGGTAGNLVVSDVSGSMAADLGIAGEVAGTRLNGANAQLRYVSEETLLADLNGGQGVRLGTFQIKTARGDAFSVTLGEGQETVGELLGLINATGSAYGVTATINRNGDGVLITDSTGGTGQLTISDASGAQTATDLHIAGEAAAGSTEIDGSMEFVIDVEAGDTLSDVAAKIQDASPDLVATVLNDGASSSPYRLSITSAVSGRRGELVFDDGGLGLSMTTLVAARDATVLVGGASGGSPLVVTSSSNTVSGILPGVDINLVGTSDDPVTLAVSRDTESIVSDLKSFVTTYNAVIDRIGALTSYNVETEERGVLLGDSAVATVESRLGRTVLRRYTEVGGSVRSLADLGISVSDGGHLSFDEDVFREKYAEDPDGVEKLFTAKDAGVGAVWSDMLDGLTADSDGVLTRRDDTLGANVDALNDRIAAMQVLLDKREAQLQRQFAAMETALSALQSQQSALTSLANLASS